jgi:hypothetical protein
LGEACEVVETEHLARAVERAERLHQVREGEETGAAIDAEVDDAAGQVYDQLEELVVGQEARDIPPHDVCRELAKHVLGRVLGLLLQVCDPLPVVPIASGGIKTELIRHSSHP